MNVKLLFFSILVCFISLQSKDDRELAAWLENVEKDLKLCQQYDNVIFNVVGL